jgi:NTP pyrophosphatase (non-canonical NTP hydrolase)
MIFSELELDVIRWSEARKIIPNSTPFAQAMKAVEEINELVDALRDNNKAEAVDAVGDTVVCLINVCALLDVNLTDCLEAAYKEIKDRKGTLGTDGIFVKDV